MQGYINSRMCGRDFIGRDMSPGQWRAVSGYGGAALPALQNHRLPNRRSRAL